MDDIEKPYESSFLKSDEEYNESKALDMSVNRIPTILRSLIALFQLSVSLISNVSVLYLFRYAVRFLLNLGYINAVTWWLSSF